MDRRRNHRLASACALAGLAATLTAAASAEAGTVRRDGSIVLYQAAVREDNVVRVFQEAGEIAVSDAAPRPANLGVGPGCRLVATNVARCGFSVAGVVVRTLDEGDTVLADSTIPLNVEAGSGDDVLHAGRAPGASRTGWFGGEGFDTITYEGSSQPVTVRKNGVADDGRPGFGDADAVATDVEKIIGSPFADVLEGHSLATAEVFRGGPGADRMSGLGGPDRFQEFGENTGADDISPGAGVEDSVDYESERRSGVRVSLDNVADDGAVGERDNIRTGMETVAGTDHADTLIGTVAREALFGSDGNDVIDGRGGADSIFCSRGNDRALIYPGDRRSECESSVGTFRLTPGRARAAAGAPVALTLSWTHPVSWRRLDEVRVVFEAGGRAVGRVVVDQETRRVSSRGRVSLVRRGTRVLARGDGKRVTVRLALRIDPRYAGRTLVAKLGARDDDGTLQAPQRAGTVRIGGSR